MCDPMSCVSRLSNLKIILIALLNLASVKLVFMLEMMFLKHVLLGIGSVNYLVEMGATRPRDFKISVLGSHKNSWAILEIHKQSKKFPDISKLS